MNPGEYRHKIIIQKWNYDLEDFEPYYPCRAKANATGSNEYFAAGAEQSAADVTFTVRYCNALKEMYLNTQMYRIIFGENIFDINGVDDFKFMHIDLIIKTTGKAPR